jgi:hypothetical protein
MTSPYPHAEEGKRLRWLRLAEKFSSGLSFAIFMGWPQSVVSMLEAGKRRMSMKKAFELRERIPGFDPMWLWEGDARNLGFDLRKRIEAEEARERAMEARVAELSRKGAS